MHAGVPGGRAGVRSSVIPTMTPINSFRNHPSELEGGMKNSGAPSKPVAYQGAGVLRKRSPQGLWGAKGLRGTKEAVNERAAAASEVEGAPLALVALKGADVASVRPVRVPVAVGTAVAAGLGLPVGTAMAAVEGQATVIAAVGTVGVVGTVAVVGTMGGAAEAKGGEALHEVVHGVRASETGPGPLGSERRGGAGGSHGESAE